MELHFFLPNSELGRNCACSKRKAHSFLMDEQIEVLCTELGSKADDVRESVLRRSPHWVEMSMVERLDDAVRAAVRVNVKKALTMADIALAIARQLGSERALALASRAKANALWFEGDCKEAVRLFSKAVALFEQIGDRNEAARTRSSSLQSLALLGEYDLAFATAEKARTVFTESGDTARLARLDINVANIFHRQNRYAEALANYESAYRLLLPYKDAEAIGVSLHNMAVCQIALDNFPEALNTYHRMRDFCEQNEMPLLMAQADYNIAYLHYLRGEYTKALDLLQSTRETFEKNSDTYHLGLCDLDQSEIYLELSLVEEAKEMAQNSRRHFEELGMGFESARSLTNLAIATSMEGDSSRALELFAQAKDITREENNQAWPNLVDLYRAVISFERGELVDALQLCAPTADFFRSVRMPTKHILSLLLLSRIHLRMGELGEAARNCDRALTILENLDAPILLYQAKLLRGRIFEAAGETDQAYECYLASRAALETLRSSLQLQELKIGFMQNRLEVYSCLIGLCLRRNSSASSLEEAFSYIEAAKSRALRDLILERPQDRQPGTQETAADQQIRNLEKELNWYYRRIEREQFSQEGVLPETIEGLKQQAKNCERRLLRLLLASPNSSTVGAALRNSTSATLEQIRATLGPEAALLEYFSLNDRVHVAVVTSKKLEIVPLAETSVVTGQLRMLQFQFSKFQLTEEYITRFQQSLLRSTQAHLRDLYQLLIQPVESFLNVRDLVIVPFGALHSLPFHALSDGQDYLIDRFRICYQPSASIFVQMHRNRAERSGPALILGVNDERTPFIRQEVGAVAAALPDARVLLGAEATESALREYGPHSSLVHIACHGIFREDSPMFSSIRLADTYVNLLDLYHMNLPVDLLTLSGCVTGLNVVVGGDELLGLTRGLIYSGARSLLLSLWEVEDQSTSEFMKRFYGLLGGPLRKADALRAAMLGVREKYEHPYFWAPFKLIGNALL